MPSSFPAARASEDGQNSRLRVGHQGPALVLADWRGFLDPDHVPRLGGIRLVVGVILLGPSHRLLQHRVGEGAIDPHHHGLVVLVGDHRPLQYTLGHWLLLTSPLLRASSRPGWSGSPRSRGGPSVPALAARAAGWRAGSAG